MVITEFVLMHTDGTGPIDWQYFAEVTVTTKTWFLPWKKKCERRKISRKYGAYWFFLDNGKYCPGLQVEDLERSYKAKLKLATCRK